MSFLFLQGHNLQALSYLTFASKYRHLHPLDFQSGLHSSFLSFLLARLGLVFSLAFSPPGPRILSHTLTFSFSISTCLLSPGNSSCQVFSLQIVESVFLVGTPLSLSLLMSFFHPAPSCSSASPRMTDADHHEDSVAGLAVSLLFSWVYTATATTAYFSFSLGEHFSVR